MMNNKKLGCGCLSIFGLVVSVLLGGTAAYSYHKGWHQLLIGHNLTPITGAKLIPDEAIMTSFISTDEEDWQQLKKLGVAPLENTIKQITTDLEQELTASNIDYQNDLKPWLGNAMVALVPSNQTLDESNILIIVGIKNPLNAYKFLKRIEKSEQERLTNVSYRGQKINVINDENGEKTNIAILKNKIAISNKIEAVQQAIDTEQEKKSFASQEKNQIALKQKIDVENNLITFYFTNYDRLLGDALEQQSIDSKQLEQLQPVESLVVGIGAIEKQLSVQSFTKIKDSVTLPTYQSLNNQIPSFYPEQTILFINSQAINTFWSTLVSFGGQDRDFTQALDGMRSATKIALGLDLDRDIFGWMDREFSVGIVPTQESLIPEFNLKLGTAIILGTSDRNTAQKTLNTLEKQIQQQLGLNSQTKQIKKQTVTQWLIPNSNLDISYGWLDQNNLLLTIGNNAFDSIGDRKQRSLQSSTKFQQFSKKLPQQNLSYFYFDLEQIMTVIKAIPYLPIDPNSEPIIILDSITAIGAASAMTEDRISKTDLVVLFK